MGSLSSGLADTWGIMQKTKAESGSGARRPQVTTSVRWYSHLLPARSGVAEFDTRAVCGAGDSPGVELGDTRAAWALPQDQADCCRVLHKVPVLDAFADSKLILIRLSRYCAQTCRHAH